MAPKRQGIVAAEEAAREEAMPKRKQRKLKVQTTDTIVNRALEDNFRGWPASLTDGKEVDGRTLRQRITDDKRKQRTDMTLAMGSNYYKALKSAYASDDDPAKQLIVGDKDLPVQASLISAIQACSSGSPNRAPLTDWLQSGGEVNQKELVGLLRVALNLRVSISQSQANLSLDILQFCVRSGFLAKYPAEMAVMKQHFDVTLMQVYINMKRERMPITTFVELYRGCMAMVMDIAAVDRVLAAGNWKGVAADIAMICGSSKLGMKMFSFALVSVTSDTVRAVIDTHVKELIKAGVVIQSLNRTKDRIKELCEAVPGSRLLADKRIVEVVYRGTSFPLEVTGLQEEIHLRLMCAMKSYAVDCGILEPLCCELDLVPLPDEKPSKAMLDSAIMKEAKVARSSANLFLAQESWSSGDFVRELLVAKAPTLHMMDPTFKIDIAWMKHMVSGGAENRLEEQILLCLPSTSNLIIPSVASSKLAKLQESPLFRFCTREAQSAVKVVAEVVTCMERGQVCNLAPLDVAKPVLQRARERMPLFCTASVIVEGQKDPKIIVGKAAAEHYFHKAENLHKKGENIDFSDVEPLHVHGYLLKDSMKDVVATMTSALLARSGGSTLGTKSGSSSAASASSAMPAKPKSSKDRAQAKAEQAAVMSLFD